jgi:hypothetical protein
MRKVRHEQRMNDLVEHSMTEPSRFHELLEGLNREDLSDLYQRLDRRVQSWGTNLTLDHQKSLAILILLRKETSNRLITAHR